jgi:hypothetical protein
MIRARSDSATRLRSIRITAIGRELAATRQVGIAAVQDRRRSVLFYACYGLGLTTARLRVAQSYTNSNLAL